MEAGQFPSSIPTIFTESNIIYYLYNELGHFSDLKSHLAMATGYPICSMVSLHLDDSLGALGFIYSSTASRMVRIWFAYGYGGGNMAVATLIINH